MASKVGKSPTVKQKRLKEQKGVTNVLKLLKPDIDRREAASVTGRLLVDAFEDCKAVYDGSSKEDILSRDFWELMAQIQADQEGVQTTMCKCLKEIFLPQMELRGEELKIVSSFGCLFW